MKLFYFDLETTGVDKMLHSIHQIAGMVEIDGTVVEKFSINMAPHPNAIIDPKAMETCGLTAEQIQAYPPAEKGFKNLKKILSKYVSPYDKKDKFFQVGYNCQAFDGQFLRKLFALQNDKYYGSWFHTATFDCMPLAAVYLEERVLDMGNFKLGTVAAELGIKVDSNLLHDALYDVTLTREIYKIVTYQQLE